MVVGLCPGHRLPSGCARTSADISWGGRLETVSRGGLGRLRAMLLGVRAIGRRLETFAVDRGLGNPLDPPL